MTMQENPTLIVPRRNFLIRALGFTAAGATLPISIITADDARARMDHHEAELRKAWQDYYGPTHKCERRRRKSAYRDGLSGQGAVSYEAPAPIDQEAQPATAGRSRQTVEAVTRTGARRFGPAPFV
jgi:hypothetical protein